MRSDYIGYGRNADVELDDYVRCARCGFPCKLSRDQHSPEGSRLGWGIRYVGLYAEVTIVGDKVVDVGTTPGSTATGAYLTEDGIVITTEDGQTLVIE